MKYIMLISYGLIFIMILKCILSLIHLRKKTSNMVLSISFIFVELFPVYKGCSLVTIVLGQFSELSITAIIIILILQINKKKITHFLNPTASFVITIFGCILYLCHFGFIPIDLYYYGYLLNTPYYLKIIYFILMIYLWIYARVLSYVWLFAIFGFIFKLQTSINVWDYLFDPILWMVSVILTINYVINRLRTTPSYV